MLQSALPRDAFRRALLWGLLAAIALVMTVPGPAAPLRALLGQAAWLVIAMLGRRAWLAWHSKPAPRGTVPQYGGMLLLGIGLALGEYLLHGGPLLGAWLSLGATPPRAGVGIAVLIIGIGIGVPLWAGQGWPAVFETTGVALEQTWSSRHGWRERLAARWATPVVDDAPPVDMADDIATPLPRPRPAPMAEEAAVVEPVARDIAPLPEPSAPTAWSRAPTPRRELPRIELPHLMENLQRATRSRPAPAAQPQQASLPLIEPAEIRARLREIHGERLASPAPAPSSAAAKPVAPASRTVVRPAAPRPNLASAQSTQLELIVASAQLETAPITVEPIARPLHAPLPLPLAVEPPPAVLAAELTIELPPTPTPATPLAEPEQKPALAWPSLETISTMQRAMAPVPAEIDVIEAAEVPVVVPWAEPTAETAMPALPGAPWLDAAPEPIAPAQPWTEEAAAPAAWAADLIARRAVAPAPAPRTEPRHYDEGMLPGVALLTPPSPQLIAMSDEELIERGILIEERLAEFKVKVRVLDAYAGPVITRYEIEPAVGVRGAQVVNLMKDLARALGLVSIRVVETIPGKTCMGMELPNPTRQMIRLSEILAAPEFTDSASKLTMALGKDITGKPIITDLAKAPHMLVAGTTGSGKSVGVNAMILSLLYKASPEDVRFIMVDPKMLELSVYDGIPHLLAPVVTDMKLAANALNWCVAEMEKRYRLMSAMGVRNLAGFNQKVKDAEKAGQKLTNPFSLTPDDPEPLSHLPFIVVVVDEFADLMMVAGKKIEELIARLAQKARAAGIHLILATQRPSVDVITGLIKANIPTRIAFQVSSKVDSRTILDQMGAEALLGQGDMLFLPPGTGYPQRVHGAFCADDEVHRVVEHLKQFGEPDYVEGILNGGFEAEAGAGGLALSGGEGGEEADPLYDEAVAFVVKNRRASISSVQRQLRIGYNRAARLIESMEAAGLVSAMESNGNRTVLVPPQD
ncbi:DNA translocase FtsK [Chitinolyticbacter meiyuanensis]|uniref:DNA translocase FtsK n=1 Tax=Chitinolyticbacter meiyuanensis TaxID=682798 RepID=UPI0024828836|nr:DNA translocase FtsK [Chitinolyticbacter meiyuanensis]